MRGLSSAVDRDIEISWATILKIWMKISPGLKLSTKEACCSLRAPGWSCSKA